MSWISALARTYDNNKSKRDTQNGIVLMPLSHLTVNAGAEVTINLQGELLRINKVEKKEQVTIVPVTEDSASRSSGVTPMPLVDKLSYIAGDYDKYSNETKSMRDHFDKYIDTLRKWAELDETPVKIKAIFQYLKKETVMSDMVKANVYDGTDIFVRFIVISDDLTEPEQTRTWLDTDIYEAFIKYYNDTLTDYGIDYATGEYVPITQKLPAKIRNSGDKAKLVSSNDTSGYTFRGRFTEAGEAVQIGYETAQKAHNALRWLIAKQGFKNGSESIVCWAVSGEAIPPVLVSTEDMIDDDEYGDEDKIGSEIQTDTNEDFAKKLNEFMAGYRQNIKPATQTVVMAVDTADGSGQGRLSITYYNELKGSDLLNNLYKWHSECKWQLFSRNRKKNDGINYFVGAPSPYEIILCAYGVSRNDMLTADEKVIAKGIDRILPCIVQGKSFPRDIMLAAVRNAGNAYRFNDYNRKRVIAAACALIVKCQYDYGKEVFSMSLNKESVDRDYLFGRLLAVLENIESYANYKSETDDRRTNALKFWGAYTQRPAKTFQVIHERLTPYFAKLGGGLTSYYAGLISEILEKLEDTGSFTNEPLKENYLLGYYSQLAQLRRRKTSNENIETEEE